MGMILDSHALAAQGFDSFSLYTNDLKNREFDKEGPQNFCSERATIVERQGASENRNYELNQGASKTDSSSCLCIEQFSYLFTNISTQALPSTVKIAVSKTIDSAKQQLFYGSGFLITPDGYIVTCAHVVKDATKITIYFQNLEIEAVLIEQDSEIDLAILKIDGLNLPYLILGDSDALKVGEWIVSIGYPFSMQPFVTKGILGAKDQIGELLFTDILINPGNSGGPLLNLKGEVIGISSALLQGNEALRGVGLAIPINQVKRKNSYKI